DLVFRRGGVRAGAAVGLLRPAAECAAHRHRTLHAGRVLWPRRLAGVAGGAALDAGFAGYPVDLPLPAAGLRDWYAWKTLRGFPPYARSNVGWITPKAYPRVTQGQLPGRVTSSTTAAMRSQRV